MRIGRSNETIIICPLANDSVAEMKADIGTKQDNGMVVDVKQEDYISS